jgi:hypothetical protein
VYGMGETKNIQIFGGEISLKTATSNIENEMGR